jgi:hypothetical protein
MRTGSLLFAGSMAALFWSAAPVALSQNYESEDGDFVVPQGALAYEDTGTLEAATPTAIRIHDSKNEVWMLTLDPHTRITVEGEAQPDCLGPGTFVRFKAEFDKRGQIKEPVSEMEIFSAQGKGALGVFTAGDNPTPLKPGRNPTAGSYEVRGKLVMFNGSDFSVMAGRSKLGGTVGDDLKVTLSLDDPSIAQNGDTVKVKAWYYDRFKPQPLFNRPGEAKAEELTITLAKPLVGTGKKPRPVGKTARPASKSRVSK